MTQRYLSIVSTDSVRHAQELYYGAPRPVAQFEGTDSLTQVEIGFISTRDSFYLSTVSESGWPYVQHRGGPKGFLKILNPQTLAFADYRGNRQLISVGAVTAGSRVALFLMDYPSQSRLKILGLAHVEDARRRPDLVEQVADARMRDKVERTFLIDVVAFDWNCSQYITPRYTIEEFKSLAGAANPPGLD
jgi:predicted pyridoxine 5'-phosphate oxidase superfamily flavin-nucleotide-binding protein